MQRCSLVFAIPPTVGLVFLMELTLALNSSLPSTRILCPLAPSPTLVLPVFLRSPVLQLRWRQKKQQGIFATSVASEIQNALSKATFLEASANSTLDEEAFVLQAPKISTQRVAMHKPAPFTFSRQEPAPFIE